jgi:hypothetical protein
MGPRFSDEARDTNRNTLALSAQHEVQYGHEQDDGEHPDDGGRS